MTNQQGAPEALRVEAAYGGDGKFIGYRLLSSGANGGLLVWADQKAMPGFRIGDHFVPGYREVIEYKPVALVEAQQPAPSAAAAEPDKADPRKFQLQGIVFALARLACAPPIAPALEHQLERLAAFYFDNGDEKFAQKLVLLKRGAFANGRRSVLVPSAAPTPQADSQPAPVREGEREAFKAAHRHLELDEVPDAWGRPMFKHSHVEASWLGWIARAARAPADSVTAPAGGETAGWQYVPVRETPEMISAVYNTVRPGTWLEVAQTVWRTMIAAAPTPPAQAADSVLEDAAPSVEATAKALAWLELPMHVRQTMRIRAEATLAAARKQARSKP